MNDKRAKTARIAEADRSKKMASKINEAKRKQLLKYLNNKKWSESYIEKGRKSFERAIKDKDFSDKVVTALGDMAEQIQDLGEQVTKLDELKTELRGPVHDVIQARHQLQAHAPNYSVVANTLLVFIMILKHKKIIERIKAMLES